MAATKSAEEKAADAKAKADAKAAAEQKSSEDTEAQSTEKSQDEIDADAKKAFEVEQENIEKRRTTTAVAEAASVAGQQRRTQEQAERQANASVGNDPETGEPLADSKVFAGQLVSTDNYVATTSEVVGRNVVEIRPAGWVGPGFEVPAVRVKEVIKLLQELKNLPKQD